MTNIISYTFNENNIRTSFYENNPVFCLNDVCDVLDIQDTKQLRTRLNQRGVYFIPTPSKGGIQKTRYINEPNLYRCILKSNKPEAKFFEDWIVEEVLPQIRKTGKYEAVDFEKVLTTPVRQHTRKLPTVRVKKEINLAESSIKAVSAIVANTVLKRLKEKEMQPDMFAEESKTEIARYCNEFYHRAESVIIMDTNLMEPTLEKGDYVLIDNNCKTFEEGKAFVVSIKDKFYIKRLFKNPLTGKIICKVDNPIMMNGTFEIDLKDIDIKAKLVNVLKKV